MSVPHDNVLLRRYVEKAMVDLPALPNVVVAILNATEKDDVTNAEIERFLTSDEAILTKVLKVVNSAYFGLPRQISSVGQAITILGLHQIRNLVLSVGVLNALSSPSPRILEFQRQFWQHAFAAAVAAKAMAKNLRLGSADQELVFVGGMLHDVGCLFLFTLFNLPYQDVVRESNRREEPVVDVERRALGITHAELGGALAERWNFPYALMELVRDHDDLGSGEISPALCCVHLADRVANRIMGPELSGVCGMPDQRALDALGVSEVELDAFETEAREQLASAAQLLGVA